MHHFSSSAFSVNQSQCSRLFELFHLSVTRSHRRTSKIGDGVSMTPYLLWRGRSIEHYLMFYLFGWSDAVFTHCPSPKTLTAHPTVRSPDIGRTIAPLPTIPQIRGQSNLLHFYRIFNKTSAQAPFSRSRLPQRSSASRARSCQGLGIPTEANKTNKKELFVLQWRYRERIKSTACGWSL